MGSWKDPRPGPGTVLCLGALLALGPGCPRGLQPLSRPHLRDGAPVAAALAGPDAGAVPVSGASDVALRFSLPGGLRVVLQENHLSRVVALQAWVDAGAADEPEELLGAAHVVEHLLFKGTRKRGAALFARELQAAGGESDAWTTLDHTVYQLLLPSRFFDAGLDLLADALQHAAFDPAELSRELPLVLEEIRQGEETPERAATQALFRAAFERHPYRRPVIGTAATVQRLTRAQLLAFFERYYGPERITLVLCGDFDAGKARRQIEAAFAGKHAGPAKGKRKAEKLGRPAEPAQAGLRITTAERADFKETQLLLGFHIPGVRCADTAALDLAAVLLGHGSGSRLAVEVERNRQAVTEAYAYSYTPRDPGMLVIGARLPPPQLGQAAQGLLGEALRLAREEVAPAELARARGIIQADRIYRRETAQGRARQLGFFASAAGGLEYQAEYDRDLLEMTPARLRQALARYLVPHNLTIAVLKPRGAAPATGNARQRVLLQAVSAAGPEQVERLLRGTVERVERQLDLRRAGRAPSAPGAGAPEPAGAVLEHRLASGARLLIVPDRSVPLLALRAAFPGGLRNEDERSAGADLLLARLLTRGTRVRSAEQLAREVEALGGSIGGFSGPSSFGLRAEVLGPAWEQGLALLADCLRNPLLAEEEIERERRRALEELRQKEEDAAQLGFRLFLKTLFPHHPYRLDPLGTPQTLMALGRRRLLDYYRRRYPLSRLTLVLVGDVDPARAVERAEALFGAGAEGEGAEALAVGTPAPVPDPAPAQPLQVFRYVNRQQAHLVVGFRGTTMSDPDRHALDVLLAILSGDDGRLARELRDKRGVAYRVSVRSMSGVDPGYLAVSLSTSPEKLEAAEVALRDELRRLVDHPVGAEELLRVQRALVGAHEIGLQRRAELAAALALHEIHGLGWRAQRERADALLRVTAADVQRVGRKYLDEQHRVLAAVLPEAMTPAAQKRTPRLAEPERPPAPASSPSSSQAARKKAPPPRRGLGVQKR